MKVNRIYSVTFGVILSIAASGFWTSAYAGWTSDSIINFLASEGPNSMVIKVTPALSSSCTYNDEAYLVDSNGTNVDYKTAAPLVLAAYLYSRTVDLDLVGCTASGRPIVIGVIIKD